MAYKKYDTYKKAEEAVKKLGGSDKYFILKPELDGPYQVAPRKDFTPEKKANGGMMNKGKKKGTEAENLKRIEEQQKAQAIRAEEASKAVKSYARKKARKMKDGGSVEGQRLTRTVPPKKGPNSQGMRGTGAAISGTKFKGVF
jgi:hypothetical protein